MNLLDRYIARQFLINIVALLVILFCFVVAVDASINLDRFGKLAVGVLERRGIENPGLIERLLTTVTIVLDLWWPRLIQLFNFLLGLVLVGAMGFTCTQFVRHREFVAMLAAGQSLARVGRPILIVAGGLTLVQALNQEFVIPRIAPLLARDTKEAGQERVGGTHLPLTPDGSGRMFQAERFDANTGNLQGVFVLERNAEGRPLRAIRAASASWDGSGWVLEGGRAESRTEHAAPVAIDRIESGLDPTQIRLNRYKAYRNCLSFAQTGRMLARRSMLDERTADELQRIRWGRVSVWMCNLLTLSLAMPFFVTREPVNMLRQSLRCAPISLTALMGGVLGSSAAIPGLPPAVGVFIPVMILLPAAIAVGSSVKT
ncbi:MAG: LptF/LptG family permease [Leptolyngbya sp. PLA3]|nr:MAG: LptF/LptG family permease [Cyanobacteria bacterium CYA]MCE7967324.1 LptF/LptG family permease [Leptolyngbya sp. PL-A3]